MTDELKRETERLLSIEMPSHLRMVYAEHEAHIAKLQAALDEARKDAERYRWLFSDDGNSVIARVNKVWRQWDGESSWHYAIDAARSK